MDNKKCYNRIIAIFIAITFFLEPLIPAEAGIVDMFKRSVQDHECSVEVIEAFIDKTTLYAGDTAKIELKLNKNYGDHFDVSLNYEQNGIYQTKKHYNKATYNAENNSYIVDIDVSQYDWNGFYQFNYGYVTCKENGVGYYIDGSNIQENIGFDIVGNEATEDRNTPIIDDVILEAGTYTVGDKVNVSVRAHDNESGISEIVAWLNVDNENSSFLRQIYDFKYNNVTGYYEGYIIVTEDMPSTKWKLSEVRAYDNCKNEHSEFFNSDKYKFDIVGTNQDIDYIPPVVKSVDVTKKVTIGEEAIIEIDAEDDKSGINNIEIRVAYNDDNNYAYEEYYAELNDKTQRYEVKIPITEETNLGIYTIDLIRTCDNSDNYGYIHSSDINKSFLVYDVNNEYNTIVADNIHVNGSFIDANIYPGEEAYVSVWVQDKIFGINSIEAIYKNKNDEVLKISNFEQENGYYNNSYKASIPTNLNEVTGGRWYFSEVTITNNNGDTRTYKREGTNEEIINYNDFRIIADERAPYVRNWNFDMYEATVGDIINVSIEVSDESSGVESVKVEFCPGQNEIGYKIVDAIYNEPTGLYECQFEIDENTISGEWSILIKATDNEGNQTNVSGTPYFNVYGTNVTIEDYLPRINDVIVSNNEATIGDIVKFEVSAEGMRLGIKEMYLYLEEPSFYNNESIKLSYNSNKNVYEGEFIVNDNTMEGIWELSSIRITLENEYNIYIGRDKFKRNIKVYGTNNNIDDKEPTFNYITTDKNSYYTEDIAKIQVRTRDNQSGIKNINLLLRMPNGEEINKSDFLYNEELELWESNLKLLEKYGVGHIQFTEITVEDNSGNIFIRNDYLNGFDVYEPKLEIKDIKVNKNQVVNGDDLIVSVKFNISSLKDTNLMIDYYRPNSWECKKFSGFIYDESTGYHNLKINIDEYTTNGLWKFNQIIAEKDGYIENLNLDYDIREKLNFEVSGNELTQDIEGPEIKRVWLDKDNAIPGDIVKVYVDAEDTRSGISLINMEFSIKDYGYHSIYVSDFIYDKSLNAYEGKIEINEDTPSDTWVASNVIVEDNCGNRSSKWFYDNEVSFNVTGTEGKVDYIPPTFNSVTVGDEFTVGEQIVIAIDTYDDLSGISSASVSITDPNNNFQGYSASLNNETGKYEAVIDVTDDMQSGYYEIYNISLNDNSNNNTNVSKYSINKQFRIYGTSNNYDDEAPTANNISINSYYFYENDTIEFSIDAIDKISGISNITLNYKNESDTITINNFTYDSIRRVWIATLDVTKENISSGYWNLKELILEDNSGNVRTYGENGEWIGASEFNVTFDTDGAIINDISVDKSSVTVGESLNVLIDAYDNESGIRDVNINIINTEKNIQVSTGEAIFNKASGLYEYEFTIGDTIPNGDYNISVWIFDNDNNQSREVKFNAFEVYGSNTSISDYMPTINNILVNKTELSVGDKLEVEMDVAPPIINGEFVERFSINLSNGSNTIYLDMWSPYDGSNTYHGIHYIDDYDLSGLYKISSMNYEGVGLYTFSNEIKEMSKFKVVRPGDNSDIIGPELNGIKVDKITAAVGDVVNYTIDATDDESGISSIKISFDGKGGGESFIPTIVDMELNEQTGLYEGSLLITEYLLNNKPRLKPEIAFLYDNAGNVTTEFFFDRDDLTVILTEGISNKPTINGVTDLMIGEGENFDNLEGITAVDSEGNDLTSEIKVSGTVDVNTPGEYRLTYYVKDKNNNETTKERIIIVNGIPKIEVNDIVLKVGDMFEALSYVKAYDYEEGDLTGEVIVKESNVDTTKGGQYTITYEVVDRRGYVITKTINVTVEYYREDFNKDGVIDELDLGILSKHYNKTNKDADFDATYDLNDDGIIDIYDQVILSKIM